VGMFICCCNMFSQHPCNVPVRITHVSTLPAVKTFFNLRVHSVTKKMPYSLLRTFFIYGFKGF
jgi:hypothetical protein